MKAHLYMGLVGGGRFAVVACTFPKPKKTWTHTTRYICDVSCKNCLKRINKDGITQKQIDAL